MQRKTTAPRPPRTYAVVVGQYAGSVDLGSLGVSPIEEGPWTIIEEGLPTIAAARALAARERTARGLTGRYDKGTPCVISTARVEDYRPRPDRERRWEIRATFAHDSDPRTIDLDPDRIRSKSSAFKAFRDYVHRVDVPTRGRIFALVGAELVRLDYYKGKPAGEETTARLSDVPPKK